jgi:hypothetical protein
VLDLLKGLTGGGWAVLYAWVLPSGLAIGAFWLLVYPQTHLFHAQFNALTPGVVAGVFVAGSVALGLTLNALYMPLYRVMEGYSLPKRIRRERVERQLAVRKRLQEKLMKHQQGLGGEGWEQGLIFEELARFPLEDYEVAPTRLGNAIRAFETYGSTRFNLDSQTMWTELNAAVPKFLQTELDRSQATVDFFVALFFLSALLGVISIALGIAELKIGILAVGALAFLSMPLWYRMSVVSTSSWSTTVRALVNVGRVKLADQMGLEMPDSFEKEREMWGLVTRFVYHGDLRYAQQLDKFRKTKVSSENKDDMATSGGERNEMDSESDEESDQD